MLTTEESQHKDEIINLTEQVLDAKGLECDERISKLSEEKLREIFEEVRKLRSSKKRKRLDQEFLYCVKCHSSRQMKIPALILTSSVLLLITMNLANANSNPIPFLPPVQHSQSQSQPSEDLQPQQQMSQTAHNQPLHTNNQFDNHSPTVTSVMPF